MDMNKDLDTDKVEVKKLPAGWYFFPLDRELISYLLRKIKGIRPFGPDMVKVRDGVQLLDPEQHHFAEFTECHDDLAFYITNKSERKTEEGVGGSKTRTIIKTTTGYWREKKKDTTVTNCDRREKKNDTGDDQIIGYKKTFTFFRGKNDKTSWRMDELTVNPETVPADVRDQTEKLIICTIRVQKPKTPEYCEYEEFEDEEESEDEEE